AGYPAAGIDTARAIARDRLQNIEGAIADCDAALALDPTLANAFNSRGLLRSRFGEYIEAVTDYDEAIRLAPEWWVPRMNRGMLIRSAELSLDAVPDLDAAIAGAQKERYPTETLILLYRLRAEAHGTAGDRAKSLADLASANRLATSRGL